MFPTAVTPKAVFLGGILCWRWALLCDDIGQMKVFQLLMLLGLVSDAISNDRFVRGGPFVNGIPGITIADVRQHTPRGVRNSVDFHKAPRLMGPLQMVPSELAYLSYHHDWFTSHAKDDPAKPVNPTYLQQNAFFYVKGDPRQEVLIQFATGQLAVIKRSQRPNAPAGNLVGLANYNSIVGLRSVVILNRLGNPVETRRLGGGDEEWLYYQDITQQSQRRVTSDQVTTGMVGNDFVNLNTRSETFVTVQRPLVLWNFVVSLTLGPGDDLRVKGLTSGQTGPGEWKVVPAP